MYRMEDNNDNNDDVNNNNTPENGNEYFECGIKYPDGKFTVLTKARTLHAAEMWRRRIQVRIDKGMYLEDGEEESTGVFAGYRYIVNGIVV
jgi:hypothetical protein